MMPKAILNVPSQVLAALLEHLLPPHAHAEQAAFLYVVAAGDGRFDCVEWYPVPDAGFAFHSAYHIELSDETRGTVIKRAHDLGASLVEVHSHVGPWPAQFSPSDLDGFQDFVPHVFWRLKNRPYFAIVVARSGFDGIAWVIGPNTPGRFGGIQVDGRLLVPTGLSRLPDNGYEEHAV